MDTEVAMRLYAVTFNRKYDGNDHITHNMPIPIIMNCLIQRNLLPCGATHARKTNHGISYIVVIDFAVIQVKFNLNEFALTI